MSDDAERERARYEALAALVEGYRRERDEARAIVGSCWLTYSEGERDKARAWAHQCERERDAARAEVSMLEDRLSESRAEVERLADERDELLVRVAEQDAELRATREVHNGARAEVERLKLSARLWADDIDAVSNAYRRGAEAMREACANAMHPIMRSMISRTEAAQTIRALPIPEEP